MFKSIRMSEKKIIKELNNKNRVKRNSRKSGEKKPVKNSRRGQTEDYSRFKNINCCIVYTNSVVCYREIAHK